MATEVVTDVVRRRFTLEEYHRMGEAGILTEGDRVELIDGEIVVMSPIGPRHASCVGRLVRLMRRFEDRSFVWIHNPTSIPPHSEPQPDVMLLNPREDFYNSAHPQPRDVFLLVEVSESSLRYDRGTKLQLYARSGYREYWIVDLEGQVIEIYRDPAGEAYGTVLQARRGDTVSPAAFPDVTLAVRDILG